MIVYLTFMLLACLFFCGLEIKRSAANLTPSWIRSSVTSQELMQHLLECCGTAVVLKDTLVQDADERVCGSCVSRKPSLFLQKIWPSWTTSRTTPRHDWNNQCPPPSASQHD